MSEDQFEQTNSEYKHLEVVLGRPFQVKPDFSKIEMFSRDEMVVVNKIPFVIPNIGEGRVVIATFLREIKSPEERIENNVVTPLGKLDFPEIDPSLTPQVPYTLPVTFNIEVDTNQRDAPKIRFKLKVKEKKYPGATDTEDLTLKTENPRRATAYKWLDSSTLEECSPYFPATHEAFSQISFVITSE